MAAGKSPDWLPTGWTEQVKVNKGRKIKYYSNMETGQKFYSKEDLIRYVEMGNRCHDTPQPKSKRKGRSSEPTPLAMKTSETPEWLPHGWIMEEKARYNGSGIGSKYKCYVDPLTGRKFYSKPQVSEYLKTEKEIGNGSVSNLAMKTNETPEWLPHGWIMEEKARNNGGKYKCYVDPVSGRKFYSKPQVSEYLKTVELNSCASQEKKMGKGSVSNPITGELTAGKTSPKLEEPQHMETLEGTSCTSKQKQMGFSKKFGNRVVIKRVTPDGLPPGWIKEIKIQKKSSGIRKDPYYTDPVSGYVFCSVKDALRYLETGEINTCAIKPKKRDELGFLNDETSPITGELSEGKTFLKLEVSQNMEDLQGTSCASKQKQTDFSKQFGKRVVIERVTPDGLPAGWIKEIKIQKKSNGIRKDPYYTDPVSGYAFRSKNDALRYLDTGEINSCAIKPKKRDELRFLNEETSVPSAANMQRIGLKTTKRRLFQGTENRVTNSLQTTDAEGLEKRQCRSAERKESNDPSNSPLPKTEGSERKLGDSDCVENETYASRSIEMAQEEQLAEHVGGNDSVRKMQIDSSNLKEKEAVSSPRRSSKRRAGIKPEIAVNFALSERALRAAARNFGENEAEASVVGLDNVSHSAPQPFETDSKTVSEDQPSTDAVQEEKYAENGMGKKSREMQINPNKSKKKEAASLPRRSSNRLAGLNPDMAANLALSEHVLRAAARKSGESEAKPWFGTISKTDKAHHAFTGPEAPSNVEKKDEGNLESQLLYPFEESWSDPCLEFAFKTLTGAIPIEDHITMQGCIPQQDDNSHPLAEFGLPNFFQTDVSSEFDSAGKPVAGNVDLPSCSGNAPQKPSLEAKEVQQTQVKS